MYATATASLENIEIKWNNKVAGCVVLSSKGYPGSYPKGLAITGIEDVSEDIIVFHAGTKLSDGELVTNGGRVLNVCALGDSLEEVRSKIYNEIEKINFDGKYYRKDIGLK
jgi:phosphoribosylamine--glycine ligase